LIESIPLAWSRGFIVEFKQVTSLLFQSRESKILLVNSAMGRTLEAKHGSSYRDIVQH
jgi:hypothetical protein